jgi:hypothetical protein
VHSWDAADHYFTRIPLSYSYKALKERSQPLSLTMQLQTRKMKEEKDIERLSLVWDRLTPQIRIWGFPSFSSAVIFESVEIEHQHASRPFFGLCSKYVILRLQSYFWISSEAIFDILTFYLHQSLFWVELIFSLDLIEMYKLLAANFWHKF